MKKLVMWAAVAAVMAACQSNANKGPVAEGEMILVGDSGQVEDVYEIYEGMIPAADGPGIEYILTLNAEIVGKDTIYSLSMTYLDAEGPGKDRTFHSKGKQEKVHRVVNKHPKKGVKLTPSNGESPIYFVMVNDTTLRLVNDSLVESVTNLNYDLVRTK